MRVHNVVALENYNNQARMNVLFPIRKAHFTDPIMGDQEVIALLPFLTVFAGMKKEIEYQYSLNK